MMNDSPEFRAYLVINRQVFPLVKRVTHIGRKLENDLVLQDPLISRYHAAILNKEGEFVISDKDSTGGTYVNGMRIQAETVLHSGDMISVANLPMLFVDDSPLAEQQYDKPTGTLRANDKTGMLDN
jgi:pSer/pThr/pTyr-binding forkhead associated (FHA) protein